MKPTIILASIIFLVVLLNSSVYGESLQDLQAKAISNRQVIEKYKKALQKTEIDVHIAKSKFLPSVDIGYAANALDESSLIENSQNSGLTGAISYNIFSGFRDTYGIEGAEYLKQASEFELNGIIQDINYRVAIKYLDIFGKQKSLSVAEDEYKLLQKRYEDAQSRFHVGLIKKNDLLKIQVELDDTQQRLKKAQAELTKSVHAMSYEINAPVDAASLAFNEFDGFPTIKDFEYYHQRMLERRSDLKALEMVLEAKKRNAMMARSAFYPSVDITGSYKTFGDNFFMGMGDNNENEFRIHLTVSMNLFDGYRKYDTLKKATLDIQSVEHDISELKNQLAVDLKNTLLDYEVAVKNVSVAQTSISQAEENLRITDISYKEGVETAADVLDAIYYLSRAKQNYINARNGVYQEYYKLTRITNDF